MSKIVGWCLWGVVGLWGLLWGCLIILRCGGWLIDVLRIQQNDLLAWYWVIVPVLAGRLHERLIHVGSLATMWKSVGASGMATSKAQCEVVCNLRELAVFLKALFSKVIQPEMELWSIDWKTPPTQPPWHPHIWGTFTIFKMIQQWRKELALLSCDWTYYISAKSHQGRYFAFLMFSSFDGWDTFFLAYLDGRVCYVALI